MAPTPLALVDVAVDAVAFLALVVLVGLAVRAVLFVDENEVHVVTDEDGDVEETFDTGVHYISPFRRSGRTVETTPVSFTLSGGRTETADGVAVTAEVSGEMQVVDPEALVAGTRSHPRDVQRRIDEAYVTQVSYHEYDEIEDDPEVLADACRGELEPALEHWGVALEGFDVEHLERVDEGTGS